MVGTPPPPGPLESWSWVVQKHSKIQIRGDLYVKYSGIRSYGPQTKRRKHTMRTKNSILFSKIDPRPHVLLGGISEAKSAENGFGAALRTVMGDEHTHTMPQSDGYCRTQLVVTGRTDGSDKKDGGPLQVGRRTPTHSQRTRMSGTNLRVGQWQRGLASPPPLLSKLGAIMRPKPIFDTNVFGDVQRGLISQTDWRHVLRQRPSRGWPLSNVTALELLVGLHAARPQDFLHVRERIALAYNLSKGRILEDPRFLLCKEVLCVPFPPDLIPPSPAVLATYMDLVRRANSLDELLHRAGFTTTSILDDLMAGPKKQWVNRVEAIATENYPQWRQLFQETGKRLPHEMRKRLEQHSAWDAQRPVFVKALLTWLGVSPAPQLLSEITTRLDAVLDFTIFVAREFLLRNYSPEKASVRCVRPVPASIPSHGQIHHRERRPRPVKENRKIQPSESNNVLPAIPAESMKLEHLKGNVPAANE